MVDYRKLKWKIYDYVQYTWVTVCIGTTITGIGLLGFSVFYYYMYEKPMKRELEERLREELLKEGRMLREAKETEMK